MMGILHWNWFGLKRILQRKISHLFGVIVSHYKITCQFRTLLEKQFVIDTKMRVKPTTCILATRSVRRVYKIGSISVVLVFIEDHKCVALLKLQLGLN